MNWFEEWFNSPYYHLLYANRSEEEAENFIQRISTYLEMKNNARVLDVACGKGRHSKTLAKLGFDVTGIDLSENNIAEANRCLTLSKHEGEQVSDTCNEKVHFEKWDMRTVYHENNFDFVFNLFSSFGYFENDEDDFRALKAMNENLKPKGDLVLDYINTEFAVKYLKPREIIPRGEIQFHVQKKIEDGFILKHIEFLAVGENHTYEECLKIINRFKFEEMLHEAGFVLKKVFGDYELNEFVAASSPRLILIAEKK